ncbi:ESX-4 secretion system protein EccB4 [Gordonia polyisoprenivorans VH2]|uniref:ESX-4 secretion system protein EccB4 n=1 Tax=Gordonia polyisoprenivorans (strain DSM 44266 / VH2) TaxID=1112204 RepID=H6MVL3_GORPV|nr:type VII secretion protein EccB [Gordonia polyisoprenivorans]AFA74107.1 ESX-4 secretion system protein EccB4 [Gordonia polyisoprenivorans VH2]
MARQLTTKAQVNGYRFLLSRLEHALVRRDARMLHDPMRSQMRALVLGTVLALLALAGFGIWGLVKPQGSVGKSAILVSKNSGGLFVVIDETLHPVLNLASARLIVGDAAAPTSVSDRKLADYPRGALLGIPGAPAGLPGSAHPGTSTWSVCDRIDDRQLAGRPDGPHAVRLAVIGERPALGDRFRTAAPEDAVLASDGRSTFLLYTVRRGDRPVPVRAEVDTADPAVMRAFGLEGATARTVSTGLLNSVPEVAPLRVPDLAAGTVAPVISAPGVRIGSVVRTVGIDGAAHYYAVLAGAVQPVGAATAEMLRLAEDGGAAEVMTVAPAVVNAVPHTATALPVGEFPSRPPHLVDVPAAPTLCTTWARGADDPRATTTMLLGRGLPIESSQRPVTLTSADGSGPGIDEVFLRPGSGEYLRVTGNEPDSTRSESLFYLNDSGIRFGVADVATGRILGLGDAPALAPWSVVSLLTPGPTLSRHDALVAHDAIAADPAGAPVAVPAG